MNLGTVASNNITSKNRFGTGSTRSYLFVCLFITVSSSCARQLPFILLNLTEFKMLVTSTNGITVHLWYKKVLALIINLVSGILTIQIMVPGRQNTLLLQPLLPDTEYKVTVTPIYADGEGVSVSAPGKTCKCEFSALLKPEYVWTKALSFGLLSLPVAVYFSINMALLCLMNMI